MSKNNYSIQRLPKLKHRKDQITKQNVTEKNLFEDSQIQSQYHQQALSKNLKNIDDNPNETYKTSKSTKRRNKKIKTLNSKLNVNLDNIKQSIAVHRKPPSNQQLNSQKYLDYDKQFYSYIQKQKISLENVIKKHKIRKIQQQFSNKLSRNSNKKLNFVSSLINNEQSSFFWHSKGIKIPPLIDGTLNLLSVIQIFTLTILYTISIVFEDLFYTQYWCFLLQIGSLCFYFIEIFLNLMAIKNKMGKKIEIIKDIIIEYIIKDFWIDIISLVILLADIIFDIQFLDYLRLFIVFKLSRCLYKVEKMEVIFRNILNEEYFELFKVFFFNFCYAHVISLLLAAMSRLSTKNWMVQKQIDLLPWLEQYVWCYYWAINIMLTVGFGDIFATNTSQALCLIFIQIFSCVVIAYNIGAIGSIISNIRAQNLLKSKKYKSFQKVMDVNNISQKLQQEVNIYIDELSNRNLQIFNEEKQFLEDLPQKLRQKYVTTTNNAILNDIPFFRSMNFRTIMSLAEILQKKIAHPQQIIIPIINKFNLMILITGQIGYMCIAKLSSLLNSKPIDSVTINDNEKPFLVSLDFIKKENVNYEAKSITFSILAEVQFDKLMQCIKESNYDFQYYCTLRDKMKDDPNQLQTYSCELCEKKSKHFKFNCPKLHYMPYKSIVIMKNLNKQKTLGKNKRQKFKRNKPKLLYPFQLQKIVNQLCKSSKEIRAIKDEKHKENKIKQETQILFKLGQNTDKQLIKILSLYNSNNSFDRIQQKTQQHADGVWIIKSDQLTDYNHYFPNRNPSRISQYIECILSPNNAFNRYTEKFIVSQK